MADAGLIKRFYEEVIIGGNLSLVDELTAEDLLDHEEGLPGQPSGREGVKFFVNAMRQAFPDLRLKTIDPTMTDGDLEAARTILSGTHTGEFMGIPASGSTVEFESIDIIRLSDGKVAEHWGVTDVLTLMLLDRVRAADGLASRLDPDLPVIVLSGRASDADRVRSFARGADDHLCKPNPHLFSAL